MVNKDVLEDLEAIVGVSMTHNPHSLKRMIWEDEMNIIYFIWKVYKIE
jgi:hypothetical protein